MTKQEFRTSQHPLVQVMRGAQMWPDPRWPERVLARERELAYGRGYNARTRFEQKARPR